MCDLSGWRRLGRREERVAATNPSKLSLRMLPPAWPCCGSRSLSRLGGIKVVLSCEYLSSGIYFRMSASRLFSIASGVVLTQPTMKILIRLTKRGSRKEYISITTKLSSYPPIECYRCQFTSIDVSLSLLRTPILTKEKHSL